MRLPKFGVEWFGAKCGFPSLGWSVLGLKAIPQVWDDWFWGQRSRPKFGVVGLGAKPGPLAQVSKEICLVN